MSSISRKITHIMLGPGEPPRFELGANCTGSPWRTVQDSFLSLMPSSDRSLPPVRFLILSVKTIFCIVMVLRCPIIPCVLKIVLNSTSVLFTQFKEYEELFIIPKEDGIWPCFATIGLTSSWEVCPTWWKITVEYYWDGTRSSWRSERSLRRVLQVYLAYYHDSIQYGSEVVTVGEIVRTLVNRAMGLIRQIGAEIQLWWQEAFHTQCVLKYRTAYRERSWQ